MYNEHNPFADRWRHAIGRDAKVRSHLQSVHFRDIEDRSLDAGHCNIRRPLSRPNSEWGERADAVVTLSANVN